MDMNTYETRKKIREPIIKIYNYGSRVYGCNTDKSDYDYIVVVESYNDDLYYSVNTGDKNYTVYSEQMFIKQIKKHHISVLECIFQNANDTYRRYFELNLSQLRHSISSVSSNSYGKCKKKIAQGDIYIGKKSLYHSIRILMFGIQIAKFGDIIDYSCANIISETVMGMSSDWDELHNKFRPIFNELKSNFKILAPLEDE
jgi:hypothetical protein